MASLVAAVELIILVVIAFALLAKPIARAVRHHAEAAALAPANTKTKTIVPHHTFVLTLPKHSRSQLGVVVLNGNGRSGAAATTASTLGSLGYHIRSTSNAKRQNYATSVVMYKRGYAAEGTRLAHDLHVKVVGPLDGMGPAALHGGQLVVILGAR